MQSSGMYTVLKIHKWCCGDTDKVYSDRGCWVTVSGSDVVLGLSKSYPGRDEKRRHFSEGLEEGGGHERQFV